ncbi:major capsid protein [Paracoccus litorisediminis]|uniref:Phage major capsid protein n=1 Tax=Paracoccus litorisediminis TaxID=2006130 RepID=A0A844HMU6_9RHOB|nr:phage major capsid protein [Paracoccus litorisediminis]MTH61196.1 phage major capsid protein [Paracoccus litorisediminis]
MPLLAAEAAKLSIEDRQRGVIEEIIKDDALFALLPFVGVTDEVYSYVREATLAQGAFVDPYEVLEESASTFTSHSTKIRRFAGQVDIDNFMDEVQSNLNPQTAIQLASKAKGMSLQFRSELVNGDTAVNAKSFDGLRKLTPAGQTLGAGTNGGALSFAQLDELLDAVPKGADCLMMRRGTWRAIRALNRAFGGNVAEDTMIENFGHPVKAYDGTPVIINDFLPANEVQGTANETCSIYALRLNEADGLHGIYGGHSAGVRMEEIGTLEDKDATRYRLKWYAGLVLKATHGVARLKGLTNI